MKTLTAPHDPQIEAASAEMPGTTQERVVLVGNPNVGKSVIFGFLTGRYVTVSNYPGTTVTVTKGKTELDGREIEIIDTPGVNSLVPMSESSIPSRLPLKRYSWSRS